MSSYDDRGSPGRMRLLYLRCFCLRAKSRFLGPLPFLASTVTFFALLLLLQGELCRFLVRQGGMTDAGDESVARQFADSVTMATG